MKTFAIVSIALSCIVGYIVTAYLLLTDNYGLSIYIGILTLIATIVWKKLIKSEIDI